MNPGELRRPVNGNGTGATLESTRVTGRVSLNLMCPFTEAMGRAGEVEFLPPGIIVILRVTGSPDPAVLDRLLTFGPHVRYEVHGRDGHATGAWVRALREGRPVIR